MKAKKKTKRKAVKTSLFRVWIGQVNQTYVDVKASDRLRASEIGYRAWRRGFAHANVLGGQELVGTEHQKPRHPVEFENAELGEEG